MRCLRTAVLQSNVASADLATHLKSFGGPSNARVATRIELAQLLDRTFHFNPDALEFSPPAAFQNESEYHQLQEAPASFIKFWRDKGFHAHRREDGMIQISPCEDMAAVELAPGLLNTMANAWVDQPQCRDQCLQKRDTSGNLHGLVQHKDTSQSDPDDQSQCRDQCLPDKDKSGDSHGLIQHNDTSQSEPEFQSQHLDQCLQVRGMSGNLHGMVQHNGTSRSSPEEQPQWPVQCSQERDKSGNLPGPVQNTWQCGPAEDQSQDSDQCSQEWDMSGNLQGPVQHLGTKDVETKLGKATRQPDGVAARGTSTPSSNDIFGLTGAAVGTVGASSGTGIFGSSEAVVASSVGNGKKSKKRDRKSGPERKIAKKARDEEIAYYAAIASAVSQRSREPARSESPTLNDGGYRGTGFTVEQIRRVFPVLAYDIMDPDTIQMMMEVHQQQL